MRVKKIISSGLIYFFLTLCSNFVAYTTTLPQNEARGDYFFYPNVTLWCHFFFALALWPKFAKFSCFTVYHMLDDSSDYSFLAQHDFIKSKKKNFPGGACSKG